MKLQIICRGSSGTPIFCFSYESVGLLFGHFLFRPTRLLLILVLLNDVETFLLTNSDGSVHFNVESYYSFCVLPLPFVWIRGSNSSKQYYIQHDCFLKVIWMVNTIVCGAGEICILTRYVIFIVLYISVCLTNVSWKDWCIRLVCVFILNFWILN